MSLAIVIVEKFKWLDNILSSMEPLEVILRKIKDL